MLGTAVESTRAPLSTTSDKHMSLEWDGELYTGKDIAYKALEGVVWVSIFVPLQGVRVLCRWHRVSDYNHDAGE